MKEKKEKKRWGLIAFIVLIMVGTSFSVVVYYGFQSQSQAAKYNGIKFSNIGNIWIASINGRQAAFSFLPADLADIKTSGNIFGTFQGKFEIDSTSEVNSTFKEPIALAQHQMGLTLEKYDIYLRKGFTSNNTFSLPVIACNNTIQNVPVIYFKFSNSTNINVNGNCVIAEASTATDFIRAKDRLLYGILGLMK